MVEPFLFNFNWRGAQLNWLNYVCVFQLILAINKIWIWISREWHVYLKKIFREFNSNMGFLQ